MKKTIVYQLWPISWEGDDQKTAIEKMTMHLAYIKLLGATHVWLSPIYPSPRCDHGYDIEDYYSIDPKLGTMRQFGRFIDIAHELDLKVVMDLVLNHMSVESAWFKKCPEFFCWKNEDLPGWNNLFDGGSSWEWNEANNGYYLHLFHKGQADLNWFPNGEINHGLVKKFMDILDFWEEIGVDGWRLDVPQAINKDLSAQTIGFRDLLVGDRDKLVISELFSNRDSFVMMEHFNPNHDPELIPGYVEAGVDFVLDVTLPNMCPDGFKAAVSRLAENDHFMVASESHDTPRRTSRAGMIGCDVIAELFDNDAQAACLYQGQELGLRNPSLTIKDINRLDAQYSMMLDSGKIDPELAFFEARANARVAISSALFAKQFCDPRSCYWVTRDWITFAQKK